MKEKAADANILETHVFVPNDVYKCTELHFAIAA